MQRKGVPNICLAFCNERCMKEASPDVRMFIKCIGESTEPAQTVQKGHEKKLKKCQRKRESDDEVTNVATV
jgi:hypothetical protein